MLFRRSLSLLLVLTLLAAAALPAGAENVGNVLVDLDKVLEASQEDVTADDNAADTSSANADTAGTDEDMYGAYDTTSISSYPTLQKGNRDEEDGAAYIVMLQNRLIALGFLQDSADGYYGENTELAVLQFQKLNGMDQTGVADAATQERLFSDMSTLVMPSDENPVYYSSDTVRVQEKLAQWGFLTGSVDGVMGSGTQKAISRFKSYVFKYVPPTPTPAPTPTPEPTPEPTLEPDELPDVEDLIIPTPTPEPTPFVPSSEIDDFLLSYVDGQNSFEVYQNAVRNGDTGSDEVYRVQSRLKQLGYLYANPDGAFGSGTELALKYFQQKAGLPETGVADESTQRALFDAYAPSSEEYVFPYKMEVDLSKQRVYAWQWTGSSYSKRVKEMKCSSGKDGTPTPTGTYQSYGGLSGEWYYFKKYNCYAKWAYGIVGGILFHSITYNTNKVQVGSESNLGHKASHGCIRLSVENAKWIYDNCPTGTTVVIHD